MKPGRNDPCPCGSGKKFKKCCADTWEVPAVGPAPMGRSAAEIAARLAEDVAPRDRGLTLTPYAVAKIAEDPNVLRSLSSRDRARVEKGLRESWTIAKVRALSTDAIVELLRRFDVAWDENEFASAAGTRWSAWSIMEDWLARGTSCRGKEEDFLGLAACELWKRLVPQRPSIEMIDDWMQEGYALLDADKIAEAASCWLQVWSTLRNRFHPSMRTMDATAEVFSGSQFLGNWVQDTLDAIWSASRSEARLVEHGRRYCEEWIAQFPDEDELLQVNFRRQLADFLFCEGDVTRAERLLLEVVEKWPKNVWGYVALADAHSNLFPASTLPKDLDAARAWIERGFVAIGPDGEGRDVLAERLRDLRGSDSKR